MSENKLQAAILIAEELNNRVEVLEQQRNTALTDHVKAEAKLKMLHKRNQKLTEEKTALEEKIKELQEK